MTTLFLLLSGHAVADFGLQSNWMSANKVPYAGQPDWWVILLAHSLIHGAAVYYATHLVYLAWAETAAHFCIDYAKGRKLLTFGSDQGWHVLCKLVWLSLCQ